MDPDPDHGGPKYADPADPDPRHCFKGLISRASSLEMMFVCAIPVRVYVQKAFFSNFKDGIVYVKPRGLVSQNLT
jgi:hypothetical protein